MHRVLVSRTVGARLLLGLFIVALLVPLVSVIQSALAAAAPTGTWTSATTISVGSAGGGGATKFYQETSVSNQGQVLTMFLADPNNPKCTMQVPGQMQGGTNPSYQTATSGEITQAVNDGSCPAGTYIGPIKLTNTYSQIAGTSNNTDGCAISDDSAIRWVLCPLLLFFQGVIEMLAHAIQDVLYTSPEQIFGCQFGDTGCNPNNAASIGFQKAFNFVRNISLGILLLAGIIMVGAQAAGLEVFSAYTVRKALPRIVVAIIGVVLAWPVLKEVVTVFDDLGQLVPSIILTAGQATGNPGSGGVNTGDVLVGSLEALIGVGGILLSTTGWGVMLLVIGGIVGILIGFIVIAVVKVAEIILIMFFTLGIALSVVPGGQRIWHFIRDGLIGLLVVFPIIMAIIAAGEAASNIAAAAGAAERATQNGTGWTWDVLAFLVLIAPFYVLAQTPKFLGGLIGTFLGVVSGRSQGMLQRLGKAKEGEKEWLHQQRMAGRTRLGSARVGGLTYRRFFTRGGMSPGWRDRYQYGATDRKRTAQSAMETVQKAGDISGDDRATRLASQADATAQNFLTRYAREEMAAGATIDVARQRASRALGAIEANFGQVGTTSSQAAAWAARAQSVTGYDASNVGLAELRDDARRLVNAGILNEADAIQIIKANKARADQSGVGWGAWQTALRAPGNYYQYNPRTGIASVQAGALPQINNMRDSTLSGGMPSNLVGGRPEAVEALAPYMEQRVRDAVTAYNTSRTAFNRREMLQRFGELQKIHDDISRVSPDNARPIADILDQTIGISGLGLPIPGAPRGAPLRVTYSIHDAMVALRQESQFQETKREFPYGPGPAAAA